MAMLACRRVSDSYLSGDQKNLAISCIWAMMNYPVMMGIEYTIVDSIRIPSWTNQYIPHRIHVWYIYLLIYRKYQPFMKVNIPFVSWMPWMLLNTHVPHLFTSKSRHDALIIVENVRILWPWEIYAWTSWDRGVKKKPEVNQLPKGLALFWICKLGRWENSDLLKVIFLTLRIIGPSKLAILRTLPLLYRFKPFHWRVQDP